MPTKFELISIDDIEAVGSTEHRRCAGRDLPQARESTACRTFKIRSAANAIGAVGVDAVVVAEGASAASTVAAMAGLAGTGQVACVVSGGNIDLTKLSSIFADSS